MVRILASGSGAGTVQKRASHKGRFATWKHVIAMESTRLLVSKPAFAVSTLIVQAWEDLSGLYVINPPAEGKLAHIADLAADPDTRVFVCVDSELARITGFAEDTIYRAVRELEALGALRQEDRRQDGARLLSTKASHWVWVAARQQVDEWAAEAAARGGAL